MTPTQTKEYFETKIDALCKKAEEMDNLIFALAEAVDCCGKKWLYTGKTLTLLEETKIGLFCVGLFDEPIENLVLKVQSPKTQVVITSENQICDKTVFCD